MPPARRELSIRGTSVHMLSDGAGAPLEPVPLQSAAAPPAGADRGADAALLGRPRSTGAAEPVRRHVGEEDPRRATACLRGVRPRATPRGAGGGRPGGHGVLSFGRSLVKFYYFHLMPYVMEHDEPSSWVTLSNRLYDPKQGQILYNQYLDQLEYAEALGWDGLCVNEHHQNCYGTMPSPNVMAAMLVRRTSRAKIAILGNGLPLRENPLRIAEEIAMLDVASGGRVISGFVRGISAEYFPTGTNQTPSRDRFYEAAELIVRSWTEEGPFPFDGRFYRYHYVTPWPRPIQKPHPPVWCPSQGSSETVEWAAKRRFPYLMVFTPVKRIAQIYGEYREACERHGYTASRYQLTANVPIAIAATDAKARELAQQHVMWVFNVGLRMPPPFWRPPGYLTEAALRRLLASPPRLPSELGFEEADREGYLIYGSPATVRDKLRVFSDELRAGILCSGLNGGSHERTLGMMELFAPEGMPHFREDAHVDETAGVGR